MTRTTIIGMRMIRTTTTDPTPTTTPTITAILVFPATGWVVVDQVLETAMPPMVSYAPVVKSCPVLTADRTKIPVICIYV